MSTLSRGRPLGGRGHADAFLHTMHHDRHKESLVHSPAGARAARSPRASVGSTPVFWVAGVGRDGARTAKGQNVS